MTSPSPRRRPQLQAARGGLGAALLLLLGVACTEEAPRHPTDPGLEAPEDADKDAHTDPGSTVQEPAPGQMPAPGAAGAPSQPSEPSEPSEPNQPSEPSEPSQPSEPSEPVPPGPVPWTPAPVLRNPVTLSDAALAQQALTLLGSSAVGAHGSCGSCHSLGRPTLTRWAQLTAEFSTACLGSSQLPDVAAVDGMMACFRQRAGKPPHFAPQSFGVYAAAAQLPWFRFVFQHASPAAAGSVTHAEFVSRVGMPLAGQPWTQPEFDVVAEWFARRAPRLFDLVPEESGEVCTEGLAPELVGYVDELALSGWRAKNAQASLLMYGCAPGQSGSACLSDLPRASADKVGESWEVPGSQIRILHDNGNHQSFFWSRSSADGRYIGSGVLDPYENDGYGGQIVDLQQQYSIAADFSYDATFFPDNSGFLMQQSGTDSPPFDGVPVALMCPQSVLAELPQEITGQEQGCTLANGAFGLYQQTAKALDGDDYLVVHGTYESDNGGFTPVFDQPSAAFESRSSVNLTPLINTGDGFDVGADEEIETPLQGDPTLSPSGGLMVLRVKGQEHLTSNGVVITADQSGYALYRVDHDAKSGAGLRDLGRICLTGGKATFSYDERWLVFHHYVEPSDAVALGFSGPNDPAFAQYQQLGSSNLMLVDLRSGASHRITGMPAGQYALFPHFRSDGWIYFVVRTLDGAEYFAASDAALTLE